MNAGPPHPALPPPGDDGPRAAVGRGLSGTTGAQARDYNQRIILQSIRSAGSLSRPEVAGITGLTGPAVAYICRRLVRDGLLLERDPPVAVRGRPGRILSINPTGAMAIGADMDGGRLTLTLMELGGRMPKRLTRLIPHAIPTAWAEAILDGIRDLAPGTGDQAPIGLGLAYAPDPGHALAAEVARQLAGQLPYPVHAQTVAIAAALGDLHFGPGLHEPSFFQILIGRTLSGGLILQGRPFPGTGGHGNDINLLIPHGGPSAAQGMGNIVSLAGLHRHLAAHGRVIDGEEALTTLADRRDSVVMDWVDICARLLEGPIVTITCLVNPPAIHLSGRLPPSLLDLLARALERRLAGGNKLPGRVRIVVAPHAMSAGAATLPFLHRLLPKDDVLQKTAGRRPRAIGQA